MAANGVRLRVHRVPPGQPRSELEDRILLVHRRLHPGVAGGATVGGALALSIDEPALAAASFGLVGLIGLFVAVSSLFSSLRAADTPREEGDARGFAQAATAALQAQATALVTLAGVTLALVIALPAGSAPSLTVKVAGVALVISALFGLLLASLVAIGLSGKAQYSVAIIVYVLTLWSIAFGLLCLASALALER